MHMSILENVTYYNIITDDNNNNYFLFIYLHILYYLLDIYSKWKNLTSR